MYRGRRRESRARGRVPGASLCPSYDIGCAPGTWSLWYWLVIRSLTVTGVTLKLRETTVLFWWDLCRAHSVITDQPISLQRSSAGNPVRVQEVHGSRYDDIVFVWAELRIESSNQIVQSCLNFRGL
jgi:hypothetical protein